MAKRLSVAREAAEGSVLLADVPRPDKLRAGTCGLIRALWATLSHAGVDTDYDELMGLCAIAFGIPAGEDAVTPGDALRCRHIPEALAALGLVGKHVVLDAADRCAVVAAIEEGLRAGFSVPVLGWPEAGCDWAVITGSDPTRRVICGWPTWPSADAYLGAAPRAEAAIVITGRTEPPKGETTVRAALERTFGLEESTAQAYCQWVQTLQDDAAEARWSSEDAEALVVQHEKFWDAIADARLSARLFLESAAGEFEPPASEWLWQASEHAAAVAGQLGLRHPPLNDIAEVCEELQAEQWRREWLDLLQAVIKDDEAMLRCIRKACNGDPLPELEW
jgi:hypothetical protein